MCPMALIKQDCGVEVVLNIRMGSSAMSVRSTYTRTAMIIVLLQHPPNFFPFTRGRSFVIHKLAVCDPTLADYGKPTASRCRLYTGSIWAIGSGNLGMDFLLSV
ncbi:hypothetical protein CVT26_004412 [Gymnopilus dilepis]|uniref:Uncharacterized protein n=1 Tax=Gymnopilus dilepis TaxID=231916 RepID=A0A409X2Y8_9AGAR|nr:hypothetical protein CVT26_004412 [Gymnopilus dilepis]